MFRLRLTPNIPQQMDGIHPSRMRKVKQPTAYIGARFSKRKSRGVASTSGIIITIRTQQWRIKTNGRECGCPEVVVEAYQAGEFVRTQKPEWKDVISSRANL